MEKPFRLQARRPRAILAARSNCHATRRLASDAQRRPARLDGQDRLSGVDETLLGDLANVADGRGLPYGDRAWLARAVTGAIRPNRDKPLWDLAHLMAALAASGDRAIDLILDPDCARSERGRRALAEAGVRVDAQGPRLALADRDWRTGWSGAARLAALGEFWLTAEGLAHFATIRGCLAELPASLRTEDVELLSRRLVRIAAGYREAHMPLAPVEKRFRAVLAFMGQRRGDARFDDDDLLAFWRKEVAQGERTQFRTVAEHFVTFERALAALGGVTGLAQAVSVEAIEDWAERLDAGLADLVGEAEERAPLAQRIKAMPDHPKILTGAERDDVADIVALEPFHRDRPLTVLRSVSFGRVQSGIANRLRRGSGGGDVAERTACADAESYADVAARADALAAHLDRMVRIAAALRLAGTGSADPRVAALLASAEADLRRVRRAGFDARRETLAAGFAAADDALADAKIALDAFAAAVGGLAARRPLEDRFEADLPVFAETFRQAYLAEETVA